MKSIDVSKKRKVTLTFLLDEEITPQLFAMKIMRACGGGTLRPGEAVMIPDTEIACFVTDEALSSSSGQQWLTTRKTSKRKPARKKRGP